MESAPFGRVGLKFGSEGRRAGEGTRPYADARALPPIRRGRSQTGPRAATWGRPYEIRGTLRPFRRGRRPRRPAGAHCAPLRRKTAPGRWFGNVRRKSGTAPTPIFHKPRAQWPGGNLERHSDFARRKFCLDLQVCVPRNGGPGVRRIWTRSVHPEPSPGDSLVTFSSLRKSLAATAAKFPGATNPRDAARRVVAQASFSCPYGAIHLLAPYEKRNHCLPPAGGGTPCA